MLKNKGLLISFSMIILIIILIISGIQLISNQNENIQSLEKEIYEKKREISASERNVKEYEGIASFLDEFEYSKEYFDSSLNLLHQLRSLEQLMFKSELYNLQHDIHDVEKSKDFVEGSINTSVKAPLNNVLTFLSDLYNINPSPTIESFELILEEEQFLSTSNEELVANIELKYRSKNKELSGFEPYNFTDYIREFNENPFGYYTYSPVEADPLEKYKDELKKEEKPKDNTIYSIVDAESNRVGIDKNLILALIEVSSNFNTEIILTDNRVEYRGLMGINPDMAPWFAELAGFEYESGMEYDIEKNIKMGATYLSHLKKTNPNTHYMLSAYHYGPSGALDKMNESTYETEFSKRVIESMNMRSWEEKQ